MAWLSDSDQKLSPQDLEQAFALFSQASDQLTGVYQELQQQVERLTTELAVANGELRRQFLEKEALSQRLELLLEALPGGVIVLSPEGSVVEANPAALQLLGAPLLGEKWVEVAHRSLRQTMSPHEWDVNATNTAQGIKRVSIGNSALDKEGGRTLLIHDITESHEMQQQLDRHQRLSAMGEMAAGLAHQLRTPLATALLYTANLTKANLLDIDRVRFAEKSLARLRHLERLIQDMLLFVKGESASQEKMSIASLMIELQQIMDPQMSLNGLDFRVDDRSEGANVLGSRKALTGAFLNLLENAMQASCNGGLVELVSEIEGSSVILRVRDTGRGFDEETRERVFEPFFTTRAEGTGLGLAIVRGVIHTHGGEVQVHSVPGMGSEFIVRLPIN